MVDGNGLENRRAGNGTVGSNPTLSAKKIRQPLIGRLIFFSGMGPSGEKYRQQRKNVVQYLKSRPLMEEYPSG